MIFNLWFLTFNYILFWEEENKNKKDKTKNIKKQTMSDLNGAWDPPERGSYALELSSLPVFVVAVFRIFLLFLCYFIL